MALIHIFLMTSVDAYLSKVSGHLTIFWEELVKVFWSIKKTNNFFHFSLFPCLFIYKIEPNPKSSISPGEEVRLKEK